MYNQWTLYLIWKNNLFTKFPTYLTNHRYNKLYFHVKWTYLHYLATNNTNNPVKLTFKHTLYSIIIWKPTLYSIIIWKPTLYSIIIWKPTLPNILPPFRTNSCNTNHFNHKDEYIDIMSYNDIWRQQGWCGISLLCSWPRTYIYSAFHSDLSNIKYFMLIFRNILWPHKLQ